MKILHITQQLVGGGVTNVVLNILNEFWRIGIENVLVTFSMPLPKYLKFLKKVVSNFYSIGMTSFSSSTSYLHIMSSLAKVHEIITKEKPEAIIIQPGWLSLFSKAIPEDTPTSIVVHGTYKNEIKFMKYHPLCGIEKLKYMLGMRISHRNEMLQLFTASRKKNIRIIAVSKNTKKELVAEGIPESKVFSILNGVDKERFKPMNKDFAKTMVEELFRIRLRNKVLLHVNPGPIKGTHILIKAFAILKRIYEEDLTLLIVGRLGPKTYREYVEKLIRSLDLEGNVVMLGYVENEKLPILYNAADLTVVPSYSEGGPLITPESLACGTPVIATDVGGNPEYLNLVHLNELLISIDSYDFSHALACKCVLGMSRDYHVNHAFIPSWKDVVRSLINIVNKITI